MKLDLRVQYIGERARELTAQKDDSSRPYLADLQKDLDRFLFPPPDYTTPIYQTGFVVCHWHTPKDSNLHHSIQRAFEKAKHSPIALEKRKIKYLSLIEDGQKRSTNFEKNWTKHRVPYKSISFKHPILRKASTNSNTARGTRSSSPKLRSKSPSCHEDSPGPSGIHERRSSSEERTADIPEIFDSPDAQVALDALPNLDVAQQTLQQLSQSTAVLTLLRNFNSQPLIKSEPAPSVELPAPISPTRLPESKPLLPEILEMANMSQNSISVPIRPKPFGSESVHTSSKSPNLTPPPTRRKPSESESINHALKSPVSSIEPFPLRPSSSGSEVPQERSVPPLIPTRLVSVGSRNVPSAASQRTSSSRPVRSSLSSAKKGEISAMTRQLWDIKRQITALKAREDILAGDLQRLNSGQNIYTLPIPKSDIPEERLQEQEEQIAALRAELNREIAARRAAEAAANEERARRVHAEGVLDDTRREYSTPFVVPALMEAFFKLAQLSSDGILDTELDYGAHSNGRW